MKFDLGSVLIKAVMEYRRNFMRDNLDDPEKALRVILSGEARDAILLSNIFRVEDYSKVDAKASEILPSLAGIPVVVDDSVHVMDIRRVS
jgi:nitrogen regulatory protein PII-like uncharacterized protein